MAAPFPNEALIDVPPGLAGTLLRVAARLPPYANKDFYSPAVQSLVSDGIRAVCQDEFDWLVNGVKERIARRPYCALVRGLQFDEGNKVFVGINRAFGELVARPYEKPRAQLVHYVQPATDLPSLRGGHESERLHTDTADWDPPVEIISMVCIRADRGRGGHSKLLDVDTIRDEVKSRLGNDRLRLLETEAVPWQLAPYCGGGVRWRSILGESRICWRRYTIDLALESEGATLSEEMLLSLDAFERVIATTDRTVDFLMAESEFLVSDNRKTIHARTPISDGIASDRLMIRSWIRVPAEER